MKYIAIVLLLIIALPVFSEKSLPSFKAAKNNTARIEKEKYDMVKPDREDIMVKPDRENISGRSQDLNLVKPTVSPRHSVITNDELELRKLLDKQTLMINDLHERLTKIEKVINKNQ